MAIDTCRAAAVVVAAAGDDEPRSPLLESNGGVRRIAAWLRRAIAGGQAPGDGGATLDHGWAIDRQRYADRSWER